MFTFRRAGAADQSTQDLQRQVAQLRAELQERNAHVASLEQRNADDKSVFDRATRQVESAADDLREQLRGVRAELAEARAEVSRLQQQRSETVRRVREGVQQELRERQQMAADAKHERDNIRETAERDRQALAEEWKGALELEKERAREREADLRAQLTEAQSQLRQQEARHAAERREMAETLPLRVEECRAREAIEAAQAARAQLMYLPLAEYSARARVEGEQRTATEAHAAEAPKPALLSFLRLTLLGRKHEGDYDTLSIGKGLYKLWKDYYKTGVISQAELRELLRGETQIDRTYLNIEGRLKWESPALTLPQDEVESFYADVVSQLPKLEWFGIADLPSVKLYYDPAQPSLPPSVTALQLNLAPYTLEELQQICARYPGLEYIALTSDECTDWGETTNIEDMEERKRRVEEILNIDTITWY